MAGCCWRGAARAPLAGVYSLPGGAVKVGETLRQAAARELMEEVGVEADILAFIDHVEPIARDGERVRAHFVIAAFVGRWLAGEPRLTPEADAVVWVDPLAIGDYPTTPELPRILRPRRGARAGPAVKRRLDLPLAAIVILALAAAQSQGAAARPAGGPAPIWEQTPTPAPATPAASAPAAAKPTAAKPPSGETPTPTPTSVESPPPYEPQLLRLAELIGSLAYLRDLCGDGDGATFRAKFAELVDAEGTTDPRKEALAGAFNRGFRDYELTYRACTPVAHEIVTRFLDEAGRIAKDVANRYSG